MSFCHHNDDNSYNYIIIEIEIIIIIKVIITIIMIMIVITVIIIMILYGSALIAGGFFNHPTSLPSQPCVFIFIFRFLKG